MPAASVPLGQAVALAQRSLSNLLDDVLDDAGTDQQTWFTLNRLVAGRAATGGPAEHTTADAP